MSRTVTWPKVGKRNGNPPCQVCGKEDWCTFSPELKLILCMRVESGRPSNNSMGGWLHSMSGSIDPALQSKPKSAPVELPPPDFEKIWLSWNKGTSRDRLTELANSLGVSTLSLEALNWVWTGEAWAIPMKSVSGRMIGMRIRTPSKEKFAVRGSSTGLFIPFVGLFPIPHALYITEGPTDTAAALTMGLFALGRPTCSACVQMIKDFISAHSQVRKVIIISDNDLRRCPKCKRKESNSEIKKCPNDNMTLIQPGQDGAKRLKDQIQRVRTSIWTPPCKDLREYLQKGGSPAEIK